MVSAVVNQALSKKGKICKERKARGKWCCKFWGCEGMENLEDLSEDSPSSHFMRFCLHALQPERLFMDFGLMGGVARVVITDAMAVSRA